MNFRNIKNSVALNAFLAALTIGSAVRADWSPAEIRQTAVQHRTGRVERMSDELDLTADQQKKMQAVYQERDKKLQALYADFRSKRSALEDDTDGKIQALLTAEQREKMKKMQQKKLVERTKNLGEKDRKKDKD